MRRTEFIGLNKLADTWLAANSAVLTINRSVYYDSFNDRFDLREWTVGADTYLEKVQLEVQFPSFCLFTRLVKSDNPGIIQGTWDVQQVGASDARMLFSREQSKIFQS